MKFKTVSFLIYLSVCCIGFKPIIASSAENWTIELTKGANNVCTDSFTVENIVGGIKDSLCVNSIQLQGNNIVVDVTRPGSTSTSVCKSLRRVAVVKLANGNKSMIINMTQRANVWECNLSSNHGMKGEAKPGNPCKIEKIECF